MHNHCMQYSNQIDIGQNRPEQGKKKSNVVLKLIAIDGNIHAFNVHSLWS